MGHPIKETLSRKLKKLGINVKKQTLPISCNQNIFVQILELLIQSNNIEVFNKIVNSKLIDYPEYYVGIAIINQKDCVSNEILQSLPSHYKNCRWAPNELKEMLSWSCDDIKKISPIFGIYWEALNQMRIRYFSHCIPNSPQFDLVKSLMRSDASK